MDTRSRWVRGVEWSVAVLLGAAIPVAAQEAPRPLSNPKPAVGLVTDLLGTPVKTRASDPSGMVPLKLGDLISAGDELRTGQGGKLELLWDHRAIVALHHDAQVTIGQVQYGQTDVRLHQGTVRIALSYNAGRVTDTLTLRTPLTTVRTRGGIIESMVPGAERQSFFSGLLNGIPGETVRVLEGIARIESLTEEGKVLTLKAGSDVSVKMGKFLAVSEHEVNQAPAQPLAIREEHRQIPGTVLHQIVNAQVSAALETGQVFMASAVGTEKEPVGTSSKGVILATTAGVPLTSLFPPSPTAGTVSPSSTPQAAPPPLQGINVGSLGPAQSGGLNSRGILTEILKDVGKRGRGSRKE